MARSKRRSSIPCGIKTSSSSFRRAMTKSMNLPVPQFLQIRGMRDIGAKWRHRNGVLQDTGTIGPFRFLKAIRLTTNPIIVLAAWVCLFNDDVLAIVALAQTRHLKRNRLRIACQMKTHE